MGRAVNQCQMSLRQNIKETETQRLRRRPKAESGFSLPLARYCHLQYKNKCSSVSTYNTVTMPGCRFCIYCMERIKVIIIIMVSHLMSDMKHPLYTYLCLQCNIIVSAITEHFCGQMIQVFVQETEISSQKSKCCLYH